MGPSQTKPSLRQQKLSGLNTKVWCYLLRGYVDKDFVINGLNGGFDLGYKGDASSTSANNSLSVNLNKEAARIKISSELKAGRIAGPFKLKPFSPFKCSPLSLREKSIPGHFRLLHDLSAPHDFRAVNINIPDSEAKVSYANVKDAVRIINKFNGAYMAKGDIKDAYRQVPLSPASYWLVGFKLDGLYYHDLRLPMGARSSCAIFERVSDSLVYILKSVYNVKYIVKLLDDFLFIGDTKESCQYALDSFQHLCNWLNIPLAEDKTVQPTQIIVFLGIELNTVKNEASVPEEKVISYARDVAALSKKHSCQLRELRSVIGKLSFCTCIIRAGRCFLRRLHDAVRGAQQPSRWIKVSEAMRADLQLWLRFLQGFNGKALLSFDQRHFTTPLIMATDASLSGYGAHMGPHYFSGLFPKGWELLSIEALEMYAVLAAMLDFVGDLCNVDVTVLCDNLPLVHCLNKSTSANKAVMIFLRPFVLHTLTHNIRVSVNHISSEDNFISDCLSRQQVAKALAAMPVKDQSPTPIPTHILPKNWKIASIL